MKKNILLGDACGMKLTTIRVLNADGQLLVECPACGGAGVMGDAEKLVEGKNKAEAKLERKRIAGKLIQKFRRNNWAVKQFACESCKGAGMNVA